MESVAELLKWVLENLNYWVVTIFMAIERGEEDAETVILLIRIE